MGNLATIKCKNPYFYSIWNLKKSWELRKEDEIDFKKDDLLILMEYDEEKGLSGNEIIVRITEVYRNLDGLEKGYCIFSLKVINRVQGIAEVGAW